MRAMDPSSPRHGLAGTPMVVTGKALTALGSRFAFYGRCSTEDHQDPVTSRAWQWDQASMATAGHGLIVAEYFDVDHSRTLPWGQRPMAAALLAEIAKPDRRFDAIVIGEPQRAFYDAQFATTYPVFRHYGVELWVPEVGGLFDAENEAHAMTMAMFGILAKAEITRTRRRVRVSMGALTRIQGRYMGGRPPYGYLLADAGPHPHPHQRSLGARLHRLEVDPVAAPIVRRIFALRLDGNSLERICTILDQEGIACPSAHDQNRNQHRDALHWQKTTVLQILTNERYTGIQVWNKSSKTEVLLDVTNPGLSHRTTFRPNPTEEWIYSETDAHPPIISTADYLRVQAIRGTRSDAVAEYRLRGLIVCAACGHRMEGSSNNGLLYYRCRRADGHTADGLPRTVYVREALIATHLAQLITAALLGPEQTDSEALTIPPTLTDQASLLRELGLRISYDAAGHTFSIDSTYGTIAVATETPKKNDYKIEEIL
ncbi:site-specific DNA recombinase [Catenulispora sp. GP43]|uniref:recombinase family protein n=1 Tax=Catenulispora sp. GP43 TaxID=3156263 RepID=UPI003515D5E6